MITFNIQTLHDTLVAFGGLVGTAVLVTMVIMAATVIRERARLRTPHGAPVAASPVAAGPAQHATQTDDPRRLVLR